jgi:hypothetical protein
LIGVHVFKWLAVGGPRLPFDIEEYVNNVAHSISLPFIRSNNTFFNHYYAMDGSMYYFY